MKVQKKTELMLSLSGVGSPWQEVVQLEKELQAVLHHPLLVNLACAPLSSRHAPARGPSANPHRSSSTSRARPSP